VVKYTCCYQSFLAVVEGSQTRNELDYSGILYGQTHFILGNFSFRARYIQAVSWQRNYICCRLILQVCNLAILYMKEICHRSWIISGYVRGCTVLGRVSRLRPFAPSHNVFNLYFVVARILSFENNVRPRCKGRIAAHPSSIHTYIQIYAVDILSLLGYWLPSTIMLLLCRC
jgi:hypothetical protein